MKIIVLVKMVPDVVEELQLAPDGRSLDRESLRLILNEGDNHGLEQALLLKERHGGTVTVLALEAPEVNDVLFAALAKGADRAVKIAEVEPGLTTLAAAARWGQIFPTIPDLLPVDLILTGCQAIDDLDGMLAPLLAHKLGIPYVGLVTQAAVDTASGKASVVREYPGGIRGEFEVLLPAVLGIQAAEKPPRYVPVARVRAAMKSRQIESVPVPTMADGGRPLVGVLQMARPETTGHAEILEGSPQDVAARICEILAARGLL